MTDRWSGAALHRGAALGQMAAIESALDGTGGEEPGKRIRDNAALAALMLTEEIGEVVRAYLGPAARPVRAILFNKTAETNWRLAWHQDRTIAVRFRVDTPGYGPWTVKQGMVHVAPPFPLLASMITIRIHLDPVDEGNAPLLVALGSQDRLVPEAEIDAAVRACEVRTCLADRGDVWVYATPILHASEAAIRPRRRRVLQLDFAAEALPPPLEWLGV